ncbi:hypothetical protein FE783_05205 [Paenibacillus mesophilus]|uniref:hypothetical protein n=1 Tax=Paenibacillus mesophilus TaxID=2582849 RepID=UPI00110EACC2|nr:hypothetical protein [Paenibacillus mesophilus]TMV52339.1 hypothetical protein FE783_05205 [Paenibacillus mesophilus]
MSLLAFELYKIFKQKGIYLTLIVMLGMSYFSLGYPFQSDLEKEVYKSWEGPITEEKVRLAVGENAELMKKLEERRRSGGDEFKPEDIYSERELIQLRVYQKIMLSQTIETNATEKINRIENENNAAGRMEKQMLEQLELAPLQYHTGPAQIVGFVEFGSFVVLGVMLLFGLSPIYSREYSSGVDHYIFSSRKGRRELVWAKLGASVIYTFFIVAAWETFSLVLNMMRHGNQGWGTSLQLFTQHTEAPYAGSPYGISLLNYHFLQLSIHFVGAIGLALMIVFISSVSKSSLITFFAGSFIFFAPIMLEGVQPIRTVLAFSYSSILRVQFLFEAFSVVNVLGYPVMYPIFAVVVVVVTSLLFISIVFRIMKHREVMA